MQYANLDSIVSWPFHNFDEASNEMESISSWEWDKMLWQWVYNDRYYVFVTSDVCDESSDETEIWEMTEEWQIFVKILEVIK